jgi:anaerobic sulfite reductase subunit B
MLDLTPKPAFIDAITEDSANARQFTFRLRNMNGAWRAAMPGQFFMLTVPAAGEAAFTFATLPDADGRFRALIRETGLLTRALFAKVVGASVGVRGPFGSPWPSLPPSARLLVIAGGCGLAPLAALLQQRAELAALTTQLVYSARDDVHAVLSSQRALWCARGVVIDEVRDHGEQAAEVLRAQAGRHVDTALQRFGAVPDAVFICGPEAMMLTVARHAVDRGIGADAVHVSLERRMHCAVGVCGHCYVADSYVCREGPTYSYARLLDLQRRGFDAANTAHPVAWMGCERS